MNSTGTSVPVEWEYTAIIALALFFMSEVMPFIRKTKGMGLIHSGICLLKGSKCMVDKALEIAEEVVKEEPKV